jgi:hypothetical protein
MAMAEAVGLNDLIFAVLSGGTPHHITANEDVVLVTGPALAVNLYVNSPGVGWSIVVYDNVAGVGKPIRNWATADGAGNWEMKVKCEDGLRVVAAGAVPGAAVLHYVPLVTP